MAQVKCHGCARGMDGIEIHWIRFGGFAHQAAPRVLNIQHVEVETPEAGDLPYCAQCLVNLKDSK